MLNRAYATLVEDEPSAREKKEFTSAACQSSVVVGTAADPPHTPTAHRMRWIHVADASLRIEAILSGQAVALPTSDLTRIVAVQPPSALLSATEPPSPTSGQTAFLPPPLAFITPIPHTVVVLRSEPHPQHAGRTRWWCASENRSRRLGRLSRQLMARHLFSHNPHRRTPANKPTITEGDDEEDGEGGCACCGDHRWFFAPHHLPSRHHQTTNAPPQPPTFSC